MAMDGTGRQDPEHRGRGPQEGRRHRHRSGHADRHGGGSVLDRSHDRAERRSRDRAVPDRRPAGQGRRRRPRLRPSRWLDPKEIRRTDRFSHYAVAAGKLAWEDAGNPEVPSERGGIVFGTGIGGIETLLVQHSVLLEKGPGRVSPFMVPALMANAAAGHLAMKFGLTGPNYCTSRRAPPRTTRSVRGCV